MPYLSSEKQFDVSKWLTLLALSRIAHCHYTFTFIVFRKDNQIQTETALVG